MDKGLVHIYTGDGKGKTSAALGLAMRCVGRGFHVIMVQFLKTADSGELQFCEKQDAIQIFRFEKKRDFFWNLSDEEKIELKNEIKTAYDFCLDTAVNKKCDMLIMDEVLCAINNKLIDESLIIDLINTKNEKVELVLTGRNASQTLIDNADYVSEIKCIKHPLDKGIGARKGIEY